MAQWFKSRSSHTLDSEQNDLLGTPQFSYCWIFCPQCYNVGETFDCQGWSIPKSIFCSQDVTLCVQSTKILAWLVHQYWHNKYEFTYLRSNGLSRERDGKIYDRLSVVAKIHCNFITYVSGACKCTIRSKTGRKILKILNLYFSKSPFCKAAFELSNNTASRTLSHVQSLVCQRIKHPYAYWKGNHKSHQCRQGFFLSSKNWFISCRVRFKTWITEIIWQWPEVFVFTLF